jgi:hypothetical protein
MSGFPDLAIGISRRQLPRRNDGIIREIICKIFTVDFFLGR